MKSVAELVNLFETHGIDASRPGFLDQPAYLKAEAQNPEFLDNYANFIKERSYSKEYLEHASKVIKDSTEFLHSRLKADGRKGACIDASLTLSRFLDKQEIWNVVLSGGLTIRFREDRGLPTLHFSPITKNQAVSAGHVWIFAPPYTIVDVTVQHQSYQQGIYSCLPTYVLAESGTAVESNPEDWFDSDILSDFATCSGTRPTMNDVVSYDKLAVERSKYFGVVEIKGPDSVLRYIPCAVGGADSPLEDMKNLCLSGDYPLTLFEKYCKAHSVTFT